MLQLLTIDTNLTRRLSNIFPHTAVFESFFSFFSLVGDSVFLWLFIIAVVFIVEEKRDHRFIFYFLASFGTTAFTVNYILKNVFDRVRPYVEIGLSQGICPSTFSFPSGHSSSSWAAAVILAAFDPKRKFFYFAIAAVISYSRIYLMCHYVSDVLAGALIGTFISGLTLHIKSSFLKKRKSG